MFTMRFHWFVSISFTLYLLTKLPPEEHEGVDDLEVIPRSIVQAPKAWRITGNPGMFRGGRRLDLLRGRTLPGKLGGTGGGDWSTQFPVIQWLAPIISEFP